MDYPQWSIGALSRPSGCAAVREKAHTREGDAIAAARRRLPMVEVDGTTRLIGQRGPATLLDAFEGRRMLITYYFMWHIGCLFPFYHLSAFFLFSFFCVSFTYYLP